MFVEVEVGVGLAVGVCVSVGVMLGVKVAVLVGVSVAVFVAVGVGVKVGGGTTVNDPPGSGPVTLPAASWDETEIGYTPGSRCDGLTCQ